MGDNAEQNTGENAPPLQQSNPTISIRPQLREKVVQNIVGLLNSRCKRKELLVSVEPIARRFEEKVSSVASDEKDYVRRIAMKLKSLDGIPAFSAAATGGPSQLNSASSGNVQSENIKLDHQHAQSQNPSQLQPRQINNNNNNSNFKSQSSNLMDISRIPPNIENKAPEQLTVVKGSISPPQVQQHQNIHKHLPNSRQVISKVAASGATTQSEQPEVSSVYRHQSVTKEQYESWQRDNAHQRKSVPPQQKLTPVKHEVQSSTLKNQQNISQPSQDHSQSPMAESTAQTEVLKRQNVQSHAVPLVQSGAERISQQKVDVPPQQKLTPVKHEVQSSTLKNQQNISQPSRDHSQSPVAESTAQNEVLKRQNVQSHAVPLVQSGAERISQQKVDVPPQQKLTPVKHEVQSSTLKNQQNISQPSRDHSQSPMAGITAQNEVLKRQNVQSHAVPLVQSGAERISQQKVDVVREEKNHNSGVSSVSQNVLRPDMGTIQSGNLPSEESKRIDTSSAAERHKDTEGWREGIHQRIMAMKKKYLSGVVEINTQLVHKSKLLDTHPNDPNREVILKKLKEAKMMIARIYRFLNLPKEEIVPVHGEKLEQWEQYIVTYFNRFFKPKTPVAQPLQPLPPQTHNPKVPEHESQPALQKNVTSSSVPVSRDVGDKFQAQAQTQPPTSNLNLPPLVEPTNVGENQSPIERLLKAVGSISPQALKSGMDDIFEVIFMDNVMESSAPLSTSKTGLRGLGQDLGAMTGCRLQARNVSLHDGGSDTQTWTPRPRLISSIPLDTCNARDTIDTESTSENHLKRRRVDRLMLLSEEIRMVNQRLIDIVVEICKEDENDVIGTVVKCRYIGVSVNLGFMKSIVPSGNSSLIHPLRLLVPTEYPNCSPAVLDKLASESNYGFEDLSNKARARLDLKLRGLNSPFSVSEVARKWEICARDVIIEYAEKFGGGTFSSRYGTWENCLNIA